jgi:hypothetical protein
MSRDWLPELDLGPKGIKHTVETVDPVIDHQ